MTNKLKLDWLALQDLLIIMMLLVIVKQLVLPYSLLYAGPISTLCGMIVGSYLLARRGLSWRDLGLAWPSSWFRLLALTVLCFFAIALTASGVNWLIDIQSGDIASGGRFDHVEGNLAAYLIILVLVWTHGSVFEELLFRAFVINRANQFLGASRTALITAAIFSALFFGYRHYYYQGFNGALKTGAIGLTLALLYIWFGRKNILPLILAHGIVNTISQTNRYLGPVGD